MPRFLPVLLLFATIAVSACGGGETPAPKQQAKDTDQEDYAMKTPPAYQSTVWNIDNLKDIGGHVPVVEGEPVVIDAPGGKALLFDGVDDGVEIGVHPLEGAEVFTLEVIFRPDEGGNAEQRFFHMQEDGGNSRILVETRLPGDGTWCLDTFMKSGDANRTLKDVTKLHPLGEWYNATLVFDGKVMRHYVNGVEEISGTMASFSPPKAGNTSAGVRLNRVHWFKGAIAKARFTRAVLTPDKFLKP